MAAKSPVDTRIPRPSGCQDQRGDHITILHHSSVPPDDSHIGLLGPRACWPSPPGPSSPQTQQLQHHCHLTPPRPTPHLPLLCHHALSSQVRSSITPSCSSTSVPTPYSDSPSSPLPPPFPKWSPQASLHPNPAWPRSRQPLQLTVPQQSPLPPTTLCASSPLSFPVRPSPTPLGWQRGTSVKCADGNRHAHRALLSGPRVAPQLSWRYRKPEPKIGPKSPGTGGQPWPSTSELSPGFRAEFPAASPASRLQGMTSNPQD